MHKHLLTASLLFFLGAGCTSTATVNTTASAEANNETPSVPSITDETREREEESVGVGVNIVGSDTGEADTGTTVEIELESGVETSMQIFTVVGENFAFSPSTMTVKKGDTVQVTFVNSDGFHDFVIDEFDGAKSTRIKSGEQETITFVADTVGTFTYYCSVGEHRAMGMKGTLTVTE